MTRARSIVRETVRPSYTRYTPTNGRKPEGAQFGVDGWLFTLPAETLGGRRFPECTYAAYQVSERGMLFWQVREVGGGRRQVGSHSTSRKGAVALAVGAVAQEREKAAARMTEAPTTSDPASRARGATHHIAEGMVTRALAAWGITAHPDEESLIGGQRNTWLVVGYDQTREGFPRMLAGPYIVLYLYREEPEEITITRAPAPGDEWHVIAGDGNWAERTLIERPADQLADCIEAIAEWVTNPLPTAGSVLRAALAKYGITAHTDVGLSYAIPLDPATPAAEAFSRAHLSVADRSPSIKHDPVTHTGWTIFLHDENGEPVGDPLYITGDGDEPVDCTADSAAAAAFIADWLASPQH